MASLGTLRVQTTVPSREAGSKRASFRERFAYQHQNRNTASYIRHPWILALIDAANYYVMAFGNRVRGNRHHKARLSSETV
jgi:hypothetical protein